MPTPISPIDLRAFARESRPGLVDQMLRGLAVGGAAAFLDDTDPQPLLLKIGEFLPGHVRWEVSQPGTGLWLAQLEKAPADRGRCCGACGGA